MIQLIKIYIERFLKQCYQQGLSQYLMTLDVKLQTIDDTMRYIQYKKTQAQLIIDRRMIELENKYINLMDERHIDQASNLYDVAMTSLKEELNKIENEYAQLENYYSQLGEDKKYTKCECNLLRSLVNAY
ncbi:hypothetical protein [Staphylococcus sp. 17KM0847]|uniref:hypothetical protein n=1 Tax=Staphylococcus sp. 17KM0847 TaxID=2583989 RepID=UPI0015DCF325|nr:hypothetical protein [Staphylococcus sp. 17KM0847]QLK86388.1 hypothetical protein FGL66_06635 [Staphylococcus sp. 17KM0847]